MKCAGRFNWAGPKKKNGELLALAEAAGFELLVTTDQNLMHQQDMRGRKIAIFVLGRGNRPQIKPHALEIVAQINSLHAPGIYYFEIMS